MTTTYDGDLDWRRLASDRNISHEVARGLWERARSSAANDPKQVERLFQHLLDDAAGAGAGASREPGRETLVNTQGVQDPATLGPGKWTRALLEGNEARGPAGTAKQPNGIAPVTVDKLYKDLAAAAQASQQLIELLKQSDPATIVEALRELRKQQGSDYLHKIIKAAGSTIERVLNQFAPDLQADAQQSEHAPPANAVPPANAAPPANAEPGVAAAGTTPGNVRAATLLKIQGAVPPAPHIGAASAPATFAGSSQLATAPVQSETIALSAAPAKTTDVSTPAAKPPVPASADTASPATASAAVAAPAMVRGPQGWPVFANGSPFELKHASPLQGGGVDGVWFVSEWLLAAGDKRDAPNGGMLSPSRARELLLALPWFDKQRIDWAANNLVFPHCISAATYAQLTVGAYYVAGLPAGQRTKIERGSKGALNAVLAINDSTLAPGLVTKLTVPMRDQLVRALAAFTRLKPVPQKVEEFASEPAFQQLRVGNGVVQVLIFRDLAEVLFGEAAYQRWSDGKPKPVKRPEQPKLAARNVYQRPVPGQLISYDNIIESNEPVWYEVKVTWPAEMPSNAVYALPPMVTPGHGGDGGNVALLKVDWEFERMAAAPQISPMTPGSNAAASSVAGTGPAAPTSTAAAGPNRTPVNLQPQRRGVITKHTNIAELHQALALVPHEDEGQFRVVAHARFDEYFAPATFEKIVTVKSTTRAMAELKNAAFSDLPARNERSSAAKFGGLLQGSGDDIHGMRTTGDLPADFASSKVGASGPSLAEILIAIGQGKPFPIDPRMANRAAQRMRFEQVLALLKEDPHAAAAVAAIKVELERFDQAENALASDRSKGWQPFVVRATFLSREENVASGALELYGSVHLEFEPTPNQPLPRLRAEVQLRDMSKRFAQADMVFTGRGNNFEGALRAAFVDCAKAYPNGKLAIVAEEIDSAALARPANPMNGDSPTSGHASAGTRRTIGFELGTDSRWKRVKAKVWDPAVNTAVNFGAMAMMAFVPGSAAAVMPLLTLYNSASAVDQVVDASAKGTLTWQTVATSTGAVALNLLPMLGQAKAFTTGWYALQTANWGGQAVLLTASVLESARALQATEVAELANLYGEYQKMDPQSADAKRLRDDITIKAQAVAHAISDTFKAALPDQALNLVAMAGAHTVATTVHGPAPAGGGRAPNVPREPGTSAEPATKPASTPPEAQPVHEPLPAKPDGGTASGSTAPKAAKPDGNAPAPQERSKVSEPEPAAPAGPVAEPARTTQVEKGNSDAHALEPAAKPARTPATTSTEKGGDSPRAGTDIADLRAALPGDLQDMALRRSPNLKGHTVRVHYKDGPVWIEAGPQATAVHIQRHVATARFLRKFEGPLGWARRLLFDVRARIKSLPKYGTAGFEARLELEKLTAIEHGILAEKKAIEHKRDQGRAQADALDADAARGQRLDRELLEIEEQLSYHADRLSSRSVGEGSVAAEGGAKRDYPVHPMELKLGPPIENGSDVTYSFDVQLPNGRDHSAITISFPKDGSPANMYLSNDPRVNGETLAIRLVEGSRTIPLTEFAIKRAEQLHLEKFGTKLAELGGSLAEDNKINFYMQYLEARARGANHETAMNHSASEISYGRHRNAAGYSKLEVKAEGQPLKTIDGTDIAAKIKEKQRDPRHRRYEQIRNLDYCALTRDYELPTSIVVIARKPQ